MYLLPNSLIVICLILVVSCGKGSSQMTSGEKAGAQHEVRIAYDAAYAIGRKDAERDLSIGRMAWELYGLPGPHMEEMEAILKRDYGVELRVVAACVVPTETKAHADGYNAVMKTALGQKYGKDVWVAATETALREQKWGEFPPPKLPPQAPGVDPASPTQVEDGDKAE